MTRYRRDLDRIVSALEAGGKIYRSRSWETVRVDKKSGGDPVTDAEREVNQLLFEILVQDGEGWLSEESADNEERLKRSRVWLVDPLDGTKEYVRRIPEWCISIALMEDGVLVCGGIYNPQTDEMFYGSRETGVICKNSSSVGRMDGEKRVGDDLSTCEPKRSRARRVETISERRFSPPADGLSGLQASTRSCREG